MTATSKKSLGIPTSERQSMLDTLLRIHKIAMAAFDCIEADAWDQDDVVAMASLPDACNEFTQAMEAIARRMVSLCTCGPGGVLRDAACPEHGVMAFLRGHA